jgi:hypothetical protein
MNSLWFSRKETIMAKWANADVLDNGINEIKNFCDKMAVISAYTADDSYATVDGNILADVAMTSGDFTLGTSGSNRTLTTASGNSDASAGATGVSSHIAFLDTTSSPQRVLWVTEETSGQTINSGNQVNFPQLVYTAAQPT